MTRLKTDDPYGGLICECGERENWLYADREGHEIEKSDLWRGYYRCGKCGLVAHWPSGEVVKTPEAC